MKGIVLAGGSGSRLWPITKSVSKQLLPIYDKPMIYYPISTLMLAGIREILLITTPNDQNAFQNVLGDGSDLGVKFSYEIQSQPNGLAEAFIIGENFLAGDSCLMVLGDNIFHGAGLGQELVNSLPESGAHIFTYEVSNPSSYGILEIDENGCPVGVFEKPIDPKSNLAITGLYFFDSRVCDIARKVEPSQRGEVEITSIISSYMEQGHLGFTRLSRGTAWLDTGSPNSLQDAASYIRIIEERTGLKVGCIEEIAFRKKWITESELMAHGKKNSPNYASYLYKVLGQDL
jgi:glucose-1-phosphate thymidylyltransferase